MNEFGNTFVRSAFLEWISGSRRFRWSTQEQNVSRAIWQVCRFNPPLSIEAWDSPLGLVMTGEAGAAPAAGAFTQTEIDFSSLAPLKSSAGDLRRCTYYVRVVPLRADGIPAGNPSAAAVLTCGDPALPEAATYEFSMGEEYRWPLLLELVNYSPFRPDRNPDAGGSYHYIVTAENAWVGWHAGEHIAISPHHDKDLFDQVEGAIGDVVQFLEDAVNWVSKAYNDVKSDAVKFVVDEIGLPEACKEGLLAAIDIGLAAVGLPPSIPNFDQVASMGKDYIAAQIVAEVPLVPKEAASVLIEKVAEGVTESYTSSGGTGGLRPDPDYLPRPALLSLRVSNTTESPTEAGTAIVLEDANHIWRDVHLKMPQLAPSEHMGVTVVLQPYWDFAFLQGNTTDRESQLKWQQSYEQKQVSFRVVGSRTAGDSITLDPKTEFVAVAPPQGSVG
jgi:hypothetical protein